MKATREAVGLYEQSTMAKFLVQGPDALHAMQRICAAEMDVAVGRSVYTQWLNTRGGIEADLTVIRQGAEKFLVLTAAATATHDMAWLRNNLTPGARV